MRADRQIAPVREPQREPGARCGEQHERHGEERKRDQRTDTHHQPTDDATRAFHRSGPIVK
jgi:hypothetical protein